MIEFETIQALIDEAGVNPNDVSSIEIDGGGVVFTLFMKVPAEKEEDRHMMLHDGEFMFYKKAFEIHRASDHVHDDQFEGHTHEEAQ